MYDEERTMVGPPAIEQSDIKDEIHKVRRRIIIYFLEGRWGRSVDFGSAMSKC
jgi:hypothetical protein